MKRQSICLVGLLLAFLISSCTLPLVARATGVVVSASALELTVGEGEQLLATVVPAVADQSVRWESSDSGIATVSQAGAVTAVAPGSATISVHTVDGDFSATTEVTVAAALSALTVTPTELTLSVGQSEQIAATLLPTEAEASRVLWVSSNEEVALVAPDGTVTAVAAGNATITAAAEGTDLTATTEVAVTEGRSDIVLDRATVQLAVGASTHVEIVGTPAGLDESDIVWSSSNSSVATVSVDGTVTAIAVGSATVSAASDDGAYTDSVAVTVIQPVEGVTVSPVDPTVGTGKVVQLSAAVTPPMADGTVLWSVDDETVASVDAAGAVTGVAPGETLVIATTLQGSFVDSVSLTVFQSVTGVLLNELSLRLAVGATGQLVETVEPTDAAVTDVTWSSSDTTVATVDGTGRVAAVGIGTAEIEVETADGGFTATAEVEVVPTVSIASPDSAAAEAGEDPGRFVITRTDTGEGELVVTYTVTGSAEAEDYQESLPGTVTILDGDTSVELTITPTDDTLGEGTESVTVELQGDPAYEVVPPTSATVDIEDDEFVGVLSFADKVFDNEEASALLDNPQEAAFATVGDSTFLYVNGGSPEDGVTAFSVAADGSLTLLEAVADSGSLFLKAPGLATGYVGTSPFLVAAGDDGGVSTFEIASDGTVTNRANFGDNGATFIDRGSGAAVHTIGSKTFVVVVNFGGGFSVFELASDGTLTNTDNVADSGSLSLAALTDVVVTTVGTTSYVVTVSFSEGLSVFELASDGSVTSSDNVPDDGTLRLDEANSVTAVQFGGSTYVTAIGPRDAGFDVFELDSEGTLSRTGGAGYSSDTHLPGASGITAVQVGMQAFIATASQGQGSLDSGVSVFSLDSDGGVTNSGNVREGTVLMPRLLRGISATLKDGEAIFVAVGPDFLGQLDRGVTTFTLD